MGPLCQHEEVSDSPRVAPVSVWGEWTRKHGTTRGAKGKWQAALMALIRGRRYGGSGRRVGIFPDRSGFREERRWHETFTTIRAGLDMPHFAAGIGYRLTEQFDLRAQVPTFFISGWDDRDGKVIPTITLTLGFDFS